MDLKTSTCLSPHVKKLYEKDFIVVCDDYSKCFDDQNLVIDFNQVMRLCKFQEDNNVVNESVKTFISILHAIHTKLLQSAISNVCQFEEIKQNVEWLSQPDHLESCWALFQQDLNDYSNKHSLECLLILTPLLERSLGDLLISTGKVKKVPALLRDLLQEDALVSLLGPPCVLFMRMLLGSPKTLNLRNIIWHGFCFPEEISNVFVNSLLLLISSIGKILKGFEITHRKFVMEWKVDQFCEENPDFDELNFTFQNLEHLAKDSRLFFAANLPLLKYIHVYIMKEDYGLASFLLLPLIESMMRNLFVIVNNCPQRMLTAENDQFYTTFTEILSKDFVKNDNELCKNKIIPVLGTEFLELMFDVLILPEGPRIRDKLGHGELQVDLCFKTSTINHFQDINRVANLLKNVLMILLQNEDNYSKSFYFRTLFPNYKSKFHPTTKLQNELIETLQEITKFLNHEDLRQIEENLNIQSNFSEKEIPELALSISTFRSHTLFRPKSEYEIVQIGLKINENLKHILENASCNMKEKLKFFGSKALRQRQRVTFMRMVSALPYLKESIFNTCIILHQILVNLNNISDDLSVGTLIKKLKQILKFTENLSSNVSIKKNKWEEVEKLISNLNQTLESVKLCFSKL